MKTHTENSYVLLLIGAGASSYMGVPPMKRFLDNFIRTLRDDKREDIIDLTKRILDYSEGYPDLETLIIEADSVRRLASTSTSQILLDCMPKEPGGVLTKRVNYQIERTEALADELWTTMLEHIRRVCVSFNKTRAREVYGPLLTSAVKNRLRIFTTNYDPIIEDTCETLALRFSENFIQREGRDYFDPKYSHLSRGDIDIVKLHGSVWWYDIPELDVIERAPYLLGDISREGKRVRRLMIIPSAFKDIYGQPFFGLYLYFLHSMENTNLCIVIGHSLRDQYLTGIIESRLMDPDFRLVVVCPVPDPKDGSKEKLLSILAMRKVIHVPFRFEEFYKEIAMFIQAIEAEPETAIAGLRQTIKEKQRYQRSQKAIMRVSPLPKTVQRGSSIPIGVKYKGELKSAYVIARLLRRGQKVVASVVAPETRSDKDKVGLLDGTVIFDGSWNLPIPIETLPGRYTLQIAAVETHFEEEQLKRRDVKDRRFGLVVT